MPASARCAHAAEFRAIRSRLIRALPALLAAAVLAAPARGADPQAAALADCERRLAAQPGGREAGCFYRVARDLGLWEEAARRLAAHLARAPGDPWLVFNLGRIELDHGSPGRAEPLFRAAAGAFAARGERDGEVWARLNTATCLERRGRAADALPQLERAAAAARGLPDGALLAQVRVYQARALEVQGRDLDRAERLLREVEGLAFPDGSLPLRIDWLSTLGNVQYSLGRLDRALATYRRLAATARAAGDPFVEATARHQLVVIQTARLPTPGVRAEALRLAREAVDAAAAARYPAAEASSLLLLARLEGGPRAGERLERCAVLARDLGEPSTLSACLHARAASLVAADPAAARRHLDAALAVTLATDDPWALLYGWADRLRVRFATAPREAALADGLALLDAVEALRDLQPPGAGRARLFAVWTEIYAWLSGRLLAGDRADIERAFALAERMRARTLLEELAAAGARTPPAAAAPLERRRDAVLAELVAVQRRLLDPLLPSGERSRLGARLGVLEDGAADLGARIDALGPRYGPAPGSVNLGEVEAALREDEALLSFQVSLWQDVYGDFAGGSWLLVSTRGGTRVYRLPDRVRLEPAVDIYLGLLENRDGGEAAPATRLHGELLRSALAELPAAVDHLVLVPDGPLFRLPFAILRADPGGAPLAVRFRLSVVPSATLWLRWRESRPPAPAVPALVLADPAFAAAPGKAGARGGLLASGARLGRLPWARREGRAVVRRLGGPPSLAMEGERASERLLKRAALGRYGIVHLAGHALVDDERPERSAVLLAPGGPGEDGLLQPREIAALPMDGQLVVLAACRSASGEVLQGEGVMSLARAFFEGGARAVVGSLWPLRDDEAASLFDRFYFHLAEGAGASEALAAAQRDRHRAGAPAAAWGGLVLLGDGERSPLPPGTRPPGLATGRSPIALIAGAAGLVVVTAVVLALLRRWRPSKAAGPRTGRRRSER